MRNIKEDATDEEIIEALKMADAWEFVEKLPEGINSMIKEFGGADAQIKTFSGYIDECWRYAMEHSDTQLKTAAKPSRANK